MEEQVGSRVVDCVKLPGFNDSPAYKCPPSGGAFIFIKKKEV